MTGESVSAVVVVHLTLALAAVALGPFTLWARKGSRTHRGLGYAWVTLMVGTALSSVFIRNHDGPNVMGYTWIHLLIPATLVGVTAGVRHIARGRIVHHRITMASVYLGACVVAGAFTLVPDRLLGRWLWHQVLGH